MSTTTSSPTMNMSKAVTIMMIGVVALAFSAIAVKEANFEPATSAFLRCAIAFVVLLPFGLNEIKKKGKLSKTGILLSILAGIFLGIDMTAWNYAIFYVGAGISSVLLNVQIIILPGLAMIFDKYRPKKIFWILAPILLFGAVMTGGVFDGPVSEGPAQIYGVPTNILGTLLGSLSGLCYGIYLYTSRKAGTVNPGRYVQPLLWVFLAQLIPQAIAMFTIAGRGFDITDGVLVNNVLPMNPETVVGDPITMTNWLWIIGLGIVGHAMAWVFIQIGSVNMSPTTAAALLLLSPVTTVIVARWTHNEIPSTLQYLGIVIVLVAVAIQNELHKPILKKLGIGSGGEEKDES